MTHLLEDFCTFLQNSPTSWHAVLEMSNRLAALDFSPLRLDKIWELEEGGKYFVTHEGSLAVFILSPKTPQAIALIAAHTDSPCLKVKPIPLVQKNNLQLLSVEVYGSPITASWANRDLALAGKMFFTKKKQVVEEALVFFDDAPVMIPFLAPHLDRELNQAGIKLNPQDHLMPICGIADKLDQQYLEDLLRREQNFDKLLDFDLFLTPLEPPKFIGKNGELLASYRLDNLASSYAGLAAFGHYKQEKEDLLPMGIFWDHEEIGSATQTGAESPFFENILQRICHFYHISQEEQAVLIEKSHCLSVDVAHGFNPNYEQKHDKNNTPLLGKGIALKYSASKRYVTSAKSAALVANSLEQASLQVQKFANRSDNSGGSTIGPIFASHLGMPTVDMGIPILSMHAAREIIACQDQLDMCAFLTYFLEEGL